MLRVATQKSPHSKKPDQYLVSLQWIDEELLIENWADWVLGSKYQGPVYAFDTFERQRARVLEAPRPDNYPAPEPSARLRVYRHHDPQHPPIPPYISVLYIGEESDDHYVKEALKSCDEGSIVVYRIGTCPVARRAIPLLYCGNHVAMQLV